MRKVAKNILPWLAAIGFEVSPLPEDPRLGFAVWGTATLVWLGLLITEPTVRRKLTYWRNEIPMLSSIMVFVLGGTIFLVAFKLMPPLRADVDTPALDVAQPELPAPIPLPEPQEPSPVTETPKTPNATTNTQTSPGSSSPNVIGNNNTVNYHAPQEMKPLVEGLRLFQRQVPSQESGSPFTVEVTIQVEADVSPFAVGLICDGPIDGGKLNQPVRANRWGQGHVTDSPGRSYYVSFRSPAVTPREPAIITLFGKQPFKVVELRRMSPSP